MSLPVKGKLYALNKLTPSPTLDMQRMSMNRMESSNYLVRKRVLDRKYKGKGPREKRGGWCESPIL